MAKVYGVLVKLIIWLIGFEITTHLFGIQLTTLFAASGFFALAAGFAVKNVVENFLSGGILRLEKTISRGDMIVVEGKWMTVYRIGLRVTIATTYDGEEVLIPNSLIAESMVTNMTRNNRLHRIQVQVGVSYDSDLKLVREVLEQTIDKLEWRSNVKNPVLYLEEFGDFSVNYVIKLWINEARESRKRKSELLEAIWWALKDRDITIAYPQMDLHLDQKVLDVMAKKSP